MENETVSSKKGTGESWTTLAEFSVMSEPGNERQAMEKVSGILEPFHIEEREIAQVKTAVAEATMNAIEHGNHFKVDHPVNIKVCINDQKIAVRIRDDGAGQEILEPEMPNLEAKLRGEQTPRGWGLFLIKNMVDEMNISVDEKHHTVELVFYRKGGKQ